MESLGVEDFDHLSFYGLEVRTYHGFYGSDPPFYFRTLATEVIDEIETEVEQDLTVPTRCGCSASSSRNLAGATLMYEPMM
jgi:hypothetical protein